MSTIQIKWRPAEATSPAEKAQIRAAKTPAEIFAAIKLTAVDWDAHEIDHEGNRVKKKFSQDAFETTFDLHTAIKLHEELVKSMSAGSANVNTVNAGGKKAGDGK